MRLLIENTTPFLDTLHDFEFLLPLFCDSSMHFCVEDAVAVHSADPYANYNLYLHPFLGCGIITTAELFLGDNLTVAHLGHNAAQQMSLLLAYLPAPVLAVGDSLSLQASTNFCWTLTEVFLVLYMISLLGLAQNVRLTPGSTQPARLIQGLQQVVYSWLFLSADKLETIDEALILILLWPWCFLIVFSHLFTAADHTIIFGFAEWGLPVTYGLAMLVEHSWAFGTYLVAYTAGALGRKSSTITAVEDAAAVFILIARVLLQAVRGLIVGMFHFISRELLWNMSSYWTHNATANSTTVLTAGDLARGFPLLQLSLDCLLTAGSFVVITAVMFLQLLFLLISVWLFCKCWFISWNQR